MEIDHLSTEQGMVTDVESHCNVKHRIVLANFANVIMPRRHKQNGAFYDFHLTTVYFSFSLQISLSDGKFG